MKQEKNYMLFIYGNFKGGDNLVAEIMSSLEPVLSSEVLKYSFGDFGIVAHFKTTQSFEDLSKYCRDVLNIWVSQYFLIENNGNVVGYGDNDITDYLFDLDNFEDMIYSKPDEDSETNEIDDVKDFTDLYKEFMNKLNLGQIGEENFEGDDSYFDDEEDDDEIRQILIRNSKNTSLSLDQLLDKISEKGIESLTKREKRVLKTYANR